MIAEFTRDAPLYSRPSLYFCLHRFLSTSSSLPSSSFRTTSTPTFLFSLELISSCIGRPLQMLWSRRRSSRSDPNTHRTQLELQLSPPRRPSLSTNLIPRPPLAPLDPLDPQASQSSLTAAAEDMSSSHLGLSSSSDDDSFALKHPTGRQNDPEAIDRKSSRYVPYNFLSLFSSSLTWFTSDHLLLHLHHVAHN